MRVLRFSLIPMPSHVFLRPREKLEGPADLVMWSDAVWGVVAYMYLNTLVHAVSHMSNHDHTHYVGEWVEIHNCASNRVRIHRQIDQAFRIFLTYVERHGKAWVRGCSGCHKLLKILEWLGDYRVYSKLNTILTFARFFLVKVVTLYIKIHYEKSYIEREFSCAN